VQRGAIPESFGHFFNGRIRARWHNFAPRAHRANIIE
jgi:hypothetical protein